MQNIERRLNDRFPRATRVIKDALPTRLKRRIKGFRSELANSPFIKSINGIDAAFVIKTRNDLRRITDSDFEREFAEQLIDAIQPNDIFLDVGSAQGLYSLIAAKKGAEVYAMDPDPVSTEAIHANIDLNPDVAQKIHVMPLALGNEDTEHTLFIDKKGTSAPSFIRTTEALKESTSVNVRTLDGLIAEGRIPIPDVVKIDVEGAEGMVLAGMQETLQSPERPKHLFIELHPDFLQQFGTSIEIVLDFIHSMGYVLEGTPIERLHEKQMHFVPRS